MSVALELPVVRYGIIAELAQRMRAHQFGFGKTALQKLVFFLQELFDVDCGYVFTLYTYGPFSSLLLSDLDSVSAIRGVEVEYYGQQGYQITPGPKGPSLSGHARHFIDAHEASIERVVKEFGGMWAKSLELFATIVFAERDARKSDVKLDTAALTSIVRSIKPHFPVEQITEAIEHLESSGYVQVQHKKAAKKTARK